MAFAPFTSDQPFKSLVKLKLAYLKRPIAQKPIKLILGSQKIRNKNLLILHALQLISVMHKNVK